MRVNIATKDIRKALKRLEDVRTEEMLSVDQVLASNVADMVARSKTLVRKKDLYLMKSIGFQKIAKAYYTFYANAPYAAYHEFGTGRFVKVPEELKKLAAEYKGAGIKNVNITPKPYFYPSIQMQRSQILKDIKNELDKLGT